MIKSPHGRIIRLKTVCELTGWSRSTIYLKMDESVFPKPIKLGKRSVGWLENEVLAWVQSRIDQSRLSIDESKLPIHSTTK
jgi:prophage regulatory protein